MFFCDFTPRLHPHRVVETNGSHAQQDVVNAATTVVTHRLQAPLNCYVGSGYFPLTMRYIMAPAFDAERRRRKRIFSLFVVQSTPSFRVYIQAYDCGAAPELIPPDPYDLANTSVRRWKWLLRHYDKALKTFASEQNAW